MASLILCFFYNHRFWETFITSIGGLDLGNTTLLFFSFISVVLLFNLLLTIFSFRYVLKPVLAILFICTALASHFTNSYGAVIDKVMIQNIFETDICEATELINGKLIFSLLIFGALPTLVFSTIRIDFSPWKRSLTSKAIIMAMTVIFFTIYVFVSYKSIAPAFRQHREMRYLLTPTNYIQALNGYRKLKYRKVEPVAKIGLDAKKSKTWKRSDRKTVTLIIVGETARAANFSLNGYPRLTNPQLGARKDIFNFSNVQSCGTATAVSIPCVFSSLGRENYSDTKASSQQGLLSVLQHAGFDVRWRDNNSGCKGVCKEVAFEDLSKPVLGEPDCNEEECYDERLLRGLKDLVRGAKNDLVIVLHQKGSHGPAYWKRYPRNFSRFGPVCSTTKFSDCTTESIVAAYDNTILYTDNVINQAIDMLMNQKEIDSSLIYFADHGESLGEKNMFLHGTPFVISPIEQRHVPMLMWMSDGFQDRLRLRRSCLDARRALPYSHDNVFHSILGLLGISTSVYRPELDILNGCTNAE